MARRGPIDRYILNAAGEPEPCEDLLTWAQWMQTAERSLAVDEINGLRVSTVFLGLDHGFAFFDDAAPPVLWETMIFPECSYCERYSSRDEALRGHARALAYAMSALRALRDKGEQ